MNEPNTIKIDDVEYIRKDAVQMPAVKPGERVLAVGRQVFIRTVTHHYTGQIVVVEPDAVVLVHAAWIADDGRFSVALETGDFSEVEPYPEDVSVEVSRGAILDVSEWRHNLPRDRK
jgi:hypothetical protein